MNRTADESSNDQLSHNILRHDFICGRCDETYPDQNTFNHHSTKLHRPNVELISEINDEYENMTMITCEVAEKDVKVKTEEEFVEHEYLVPSKVTCEKCETNLALELALKLQNSMHHKVDESISSRDVIGPMNKQYDQIKQKCQCSKRNSGPGNGNDVGNCISCKNFSRKVLAPGITVYNENEYSMTLDEDEINACNATDTEIIQTDITNQNSEKSNQKEARKSTIFFNAKIVENRQNNDQKDHNRNLEVSFNCHKRGERFVVVTKLKSHSHIKWETYKTMLGDAVNSGCHKDETDDVISEKQTTRLYEYCNAGQVRKCSDGDHMFDYDGKHVNHVGSQYNSTRKICGKPYISEALYNHHSKEYHGSKPEPPAEADDNKHD